jgi:hypothetical protein
MVPKYFLFCERLPKLPSGKSDAGAAMALLQQALDDRPAGVFILEGGRAVLATVA